MINPVNHAKSAGAVATYRVEPYVMAADVYAAPPHVGRGGWTWYTGSAGWMYRLAAWPVFKLRYRYGDTVYRISVVRDGGAGVEPSDHVISLVDDRREHLIELRIP
jgi:cellobiose phosphorylase